MAFSPDVFKKAAMGGGPKGAAPAPAKPGMDFEALMGEPTPAEGGMEDVMEGGEAGEAAESPLAQALENAGYTVSPDQLNQIKEILGEAGGAVPAAAPAKPTSKLSQLLGSK